MKDKRAEAVARKMLMDVDNEAYDSLERGKPGRLLIYNNGKSPPVEALFDRLKPSWPTIRKMKNIMAVLLCLVGVVAIALSTVAGSNKSSIMATQIPPQGEYVGRVRGAPVSRIVGTINPQLVIGVCCVLSGLWMVFSMNVDVVCTRMMNEVSDFAAYLIYYHICFQGTAIMLTVLPLAGVINVYELAFAVTLTWAELLMYLYTDIMNVRAMHSWEMVDTSKRRVPSDPVATFRRLCPAEEPYLLFSLKPLLGAVVVHLFTWIIIVIHVVEAIQSNSYKIETSFIVIVMTTLFLQLLVPLIKTLQFARLELLPWFKFYKFMLLSMETVECVNMLFIALFLFL
jgi:hypothetical protein